MEEKVKITLEGSGLKFEGETDFLAATQILQFISKPPASSDASVLVNDAQGQVVHIGSDGVSAVPQFNSPIDAIKNSGARNYPQKIAVLGLYLTQRDKRETFDPKEVQNLLRRIGDRPANFGRDLRTATHINNYVVDEGGGEYIVTEYGKEQVQSGFDQAQSSPVKKKRAKKKKDTETI